MKTAKFIIGMMIILAVWLLVIPLMQDSAGLLPTWLTDTTYYMLIIFFIIVAVIVLGFIYIL